jgi:hypothetical protein
VEGGVLEDAVKDGAKLLQVVEKEMFWRMAELLAGSGKEKALEDGGEEETELLEIQEDGGEQEAEPLPCGGEGEVL